MLQRPSVVSSSSRRIMAHTRVSVSSVVTIAMGFLVLTMPHVLAAGVTAAVYVRDGPGAPAPPSQCAAESVADLAARAAMPEFNAAQAARADKRVSRWQMRLCGCTEGGWIAAWAAQGVTG